VIAAQWREVLASVIENGFGEMVSTPKAVDGQAAHLRQAARLALHKLERERFWDKRSVGGAIKAAGRVQA